MPSAAPMSVIGASVVPGLFQPPLLPSRQSLVNQVVLPSTLSLLGTTSLDSSRSSPGSCCAVLTGASLAGNADEAGVELRTVALCSVRES